MAYRSIDFEHCLRRYQGAPCHRCEMICPNKAIHDGQIDEPLCDDCGLCTAVCPMGAVRTQVDYEALFVRIEQMEEPLLVCKKTSSSGLPCLGVLTRHILWGLASRRPLRIDRSRCASCRPAVAKWLTQEVDACSEALALCGKPPIRCVSTDPHEKAAAVSRRAFFRALFHAAGHEIEAIAKSESGVMYTFLPQNLLARQAINPAEMASLLVGIEVGDACDGCRLCEKICPHQALQIVMAEEGAVLSFHAERCTSCDLCQGNCPQHALKIHPVFDGKNRFVLQTTEQETVPDPKENLFFLQRG